METDVRRFEELLGTITEGSVGVTEYVKKISSTCDTQGDPSKGISFLEVKAHTQLSYLKNLALLILKKVNGKSIQNDPVVDRLTELRIVEQKLQYQIEKLIQSLNAELNVTGEKDPLSFKPHPQAMDEDSDEDVDIESEAEEKREQESVQNKKYIPPKLMATPYIEPRDREVERMRRRIMNTSMLQDLQKQYSQAPEEITERQSLMKHRELLEQQRKTEYEEEHFIRLRQPKGQTKMSLNAGNNLAGVFDFAGYFASSSGIRVSHLRQM
ncbi:Sas10/Utp3/C1D family protein [Trichuris suis]|nr:Sas10/Utp3/C1D family protein [Trichuris suis]